MKMSKGSKYIVLMLLLFAVIGMFKAFAQQDISIDNKHLRYDTDGKVIDAHDGRLVKFGNLYYIYGTSYENTDGFVTTNHYHCYSSPDLKTWTFRGHILDNQPVGVYYRPHVIYNASTKKYVLWYNWYKTLWQGLFGVATSDVPTGPFEIQSTNVATANAGGGVGDLDLFADDDGKAYLAYTTIGTHSVSIDLLSDDYLSSTKSNSGFLLSNSEACSMFKRKGIYYLLAENTCAFCKEGAGAYVFTASNPLGPYLCMNNINRQSSGGNFPATATIDGDLIGKNWENFGGWNDNTSDFYPDWLEITFDSPKKMNEIDVFTLQDALKLSVAPTSTMTFSKYGITNFDVQYWSGTDWNNVPGGSIQSNNLVWRKVSFDTITCQKIRIKVNESLEKYSRIVEVQAFEKGVNIAAASNGGSVKASSEYGTAIIIPAQQTHVAEVTTTTDTAFIWMGDLWGSRPDGIKGHDFQYWSDPLKFDSNGAISTMQFVDSFKISINVPPSSLKISEAKINFNAVPDSSVKVTVTANANWELLSSASWLHFSKISASNNAEIEIEADENTSINARNAMVQIKAPAMADQFVSISQKGALPFFTLSTEALSFGGKVPDTLNVQVSTNCTWRLSSLTSWLKLVPTSGTGSALIKVIANQLNNTALERFANISFTPTGAALKKMVVKQDVAISSTQNPTQRNFLYYPNPANQLLTIHFGNDLYKKLNIINMTGKTVLSFDVPNQSIDMKIDVSGLSKGVYCLDLQGKNHLRRKLIVK